ncbi:hypothetical protein B0H14DRAFT_2570452 [Mycena olivaceomarginata]|nr:hypothetical protein B0H14DRAFT_2570452 [Mycena olivaceomarginata]
MVVEDLCVVGSREWLFGNRLLKKLAQRLPALANSIFEQGRGAGAADEVVGHSVPSTFSITGPRDIKTDSGFGFRVIVAGMESESLSSRRDEEWMRINWASTKSPSSKHNDARRTLLPQPRTQIWKR